jgi:hypothetical protein
LTGFLIRKKLFKSPDLPDRGVSMIEKIMPIIRVRISAIALVIIIGLTLFGSALAADAITIGVGQSTLTDATAAMNAAADTAKTALGAKTAAIVIAWVDSGNEVAFSQLAAKFATGTKIYGIPGKNLFTQNGRDRKALVLAFAGQINASHVVYPHNGNFPSVGKQIGTALKAITTKPTDGKLMIIVGDCNYPSDADAITGLLSTYGTTAWCMGGSCGKVFADGQIASVSMLGILLYGEFDCGFGLETGSTNSAQPAQTAINSANSAYSSKKPTLSVIFDCVSRYEALGASGLTSEFTVMTQSLGANGPFVGGYYLGEIGKQNLTSNAKGSGGAFSITNIYSRAATSIVYKNGQNNFNGKIPSLQSGKGPFQEYRLDGSRIFNLNNQSAGMIVSKDGLENIESAKIFIKK